MTDPLVQQLNDLFANAEWTVETHTGTKYSARWPLSATASVSLDVPFHATAHRRAGGDNEHTEPWFSQLAVVIEAGTGADAVRIAKLTDADAGAIWKSIDAQAAARRVAIHDRALSALASHDPNHPNREKTQK